MGIFYILVNSSGSYVKTSEQFKTQGGPSKSWGKDWKAIPARDLKQARRLAAQEFKNTRGQ